MNVTHVKNVLVAAGVPFTGRLKARPSYGLCFIQWGGHEKKPVFVQYQFTHWIAVAGEMVFDVNAPKLISWQEWSQVISVISKDEGWGDGTFFIRSAIAVHKKSKST